MLRLCSASLGLLAFSVAIFAGLWAGNSAVEILSRALWSMVAFAGIGLGVGWVARRVVQEHAERREAELRARARQSRQPEEHPGAAQSAEDETPASREPAGVAS